MNIKSVKLHDANGDPNGRMFVNYMRRSCLNIRRNNITSFGKEHLYPHYEDRVHILSLFIKQIKEQQIQLREEM